MAYITALKGLAISLLISVMILTSISIVWGQVMDNTNRVVKICRRLTEIQELLDYVPLYDVEEFELIEEKNELTKELSGLNVAS